MIMKYLSKLLLKRFFTLTLFPLKYLISKGDVIIIQTYSRSIYCENTKYLYEYDNRFIENSIFSFNEPLFKGYWNFEGPSPVDSFSQVGDSMAVLLNGAAKVPGTHGKGVICDGIDDNMRFDSIHNSKFTEYTAQSWVKLNNFRSGFSTVLGTATEGYPSLGINYEKQL